MRALASIVVLIALPATAIAADLSGSVTLMRRGKPSRLGDLKDAVVWFEPAGAAPAAGKPRTEEWLMRTKDKEFDPHVLAIRRGESVRFPNQDPILHNVFSVSGKNSFDLGFYKTGPGEKVVFGEAGLVRVFCNVHHTMVGYIMVLDTALMARPDDSGRFTIRGVPEGGGTLHVWHERSDQVSVAVPAGSAPKPLQVSLEVSRPRVPQHTNKHGRAYSSTSSYD